jgi:beta-exotoxin I transport system permease protein
MAALFLRSVLGRALFDQRRSIGWWAVGIAGFVVLMVLYWPSVRDQGEDLQRIVNSMPAAMRAFSGDLSAFTSAPGYLQGELFGLALPILLVVYAIGRGSDAIAGEEERGHLEITLAEPISRRRVALEKAGALVLGLVALGLAAFITIAVGAAALSMGLSGTRLLVAVAGTVVFGLVMGALALAVGGLTGRKAIATGVPTGVVVVGWLLEGIARLTKTAEWALPLSPFHHYTVGAQLTGAAEPWRLLLLLAPAVVLVAVAAWGLERRDVGV